MSTHNMFLYTVIIYLPILNLSWVTQYGGSPGQVGEDRFSRDVAHICVSYHLYVSGNELDHR